MTDLGSSAPEGSSTLIKGSVLSGSEITVVPYFTLGRAPISPTLAGITCGAMLFVLVIPVGRLVQVRSAIYCTLRLRRH